MHRNRYLIVDVGDKVPVSGMILVQNSILRMENTGVTKIIGEINFLSRLKIFVESDLKYGSKLLSTSLGSMYLCCKPPALLHYDSVLK